MRLTAPLCKYHLGRLIKHNWFRHGRQVPFDTCVEPLLAKKGIKILDPKDVILPMRPKNPIVDLPTEKFLHKLPQAMNETHPDWKDKACWNISNTELLIQGVEQAQALTKTIIIKQGMPERIEALVEKTTDDINKVLEKTIRSSNIFDTEQQKLPIVKDPLRPAWNFPRDYGITAVRKSSNLSQRMIQICESICGPDLIRERQLVDNGIVQAAIERDDKLLLINMKIDLMISSSKGLSPVADNEIDESIQIPNLHPMHPTIGLLKKNIYKSDNMYPIGKDSQFKNPHTIFFYHNPDTVKNRTELPVKESQLLARSLVKSFAVGVASARQRWGDDFDGDLPEPLTIQCVQSNGKSFHFSVFQLNTLDIGAEGARVNYWWSLPQVDLFNEAKYETGRPVLQGYNPEVFQRILAFYRNN